jgi:N12 class adenine-specific DNA methylase
MPTKRERITALYAEALAGVTGSVRDWTAFLASACMNYKLPFDEQLLVFAQRPDATAVLELEKWNRLFDRWVNRGAKGIAVLSDETASRLKHYFDISDTHEGRRARPVPTWSMRPQYESDAIEALEAAFGGLADKGGLGGAIVSASANAAEDNFEDYLTDLTAITGRPTDASAFQQVLRSSVAYMALRRCGIDPWALLAETDFAGLERFSDSAAATVLGTAVADTAEMEIREIAATVLALEREQPRIRTIAAAAPTVDNKPQTDNETDGRSNDGTDLQRDAGGLPAAGAGRADGGDAGHRDVGAAQEALFEGAPQGDVRGDEDAGDAVLAPGRAEPAGSSDVGEPEQADGEGPGRGRGDEAARSDGVGGQDGRGAQPGRRDGEPRPDLLLEPKPPEAATDSPDAGAAYREGAAPSAIQGEDAYRIPLGTTVMIGNNAYELVRMDEADVLLFDETSPLFLVEMGRQDFFRRVAENPLNGHLRTGAAARPALAKASGHDVALDIDDDMAAALVGFKLEAGGRRYAVESIDLINDKVRLRDGTFAEGTGFPIFRSEGLGWLIERITPDAVDAHLAHIKGGAQPEPEPQGLPDEKEGHQAALGFAAGQEREPVAPALALGQAPSMQRPQTRRDFRITDDDLGNGGAKQRAEWNIDAIRLVQTLEDEDRLATAEEQEVLSRYVGWGCIPQIFDEGNAAWASERAYLQFLLTDEDYAAARASTINAHYTSPTVIKAIYEAVANMGFTDGNVLEPSCGIGNFLGLVPESMKGSRFFGVEIDPVTASIAKQLYQTADIRTEGFEASSFPDSFFDVAIGNVPFGSYKLADKRYDRHQFLIHDYFFAKALDKVRPGGIVAFVTSKGTLDKKNGAVRRYIAERAELLGAIRLPNNAFKDNAGTEVTADIVFLQKRERPEAAEPSWVHLGINADGIPVNSYFTDNPEMVLGRMAHDDRMYGNATETTCEPYPEADLAEQLKGAIANIHAEIGAWDRDEADEQDRSIPADPEVRNFSFASVEGKVYFREDSRMHPQELSATATSRVKGLIAIRDIVRGLIQLQADDAPDAEVASAQRDLGRAYKSFTKRYGLITSRGNSMAFCRDSSYPLLASLEDVGEDGRLIGLADLFTKRTIRPYTRPTSADTPAEALAVSLAERAKVDLPYMAGLTGMPEKDIASELSGVIFRVPDPLGTGAEWQTADEYLSGNVREKLMVARLAAELDTSLRVNVEALEKAVPKDLTASEINVRLGATWIPVTDIQDFMFELLQTPRYQRFNVTVHYAPATAQWSVSGKSRDKGNVLASATFGTRRKSAYEIIEDTLNLRDVRVTDRDEQPDGTVKYVLNRKETAIARARQDAIKAAFAEWVWADPERRERLCRRYNDAFNSMRLRTFDGSHLSFPGMNPEVRLNEHQRDAVARVIYGGNTLLAHVVGAGKTYTMAAAAQEMKRLQLCSKSLIVVPNHLTEQWASEYLRLYPAANILVATKRDFERKNRRRFCARIATGDYDAVIIGHSQFEKVPMSIEHQRASIQGEIDDIAGGIVQMKAERGERVTVKQMETAKKRLEARLAKLNDQSRKDDVITFEELGVDRLFIDESHFYKNLFMFTKMRNVGGIAQSEAQKSSDLFMKCRYLDEKTGGKGVIFATGTPVSNSMVELYTVQRYLQYPELQRLGLTHFDCWASTFGETVSAVELSPEGTGYRQKTRFSKFYNLPELMALFRQVADIQTADMLSLPVPEVDYHNVSVKPSEMQRELVASLGERADRVRSGMVSPEADNMLVITNDGRKLALDQRLVNPMLPDFEGSKVSVCAENVFRIWEHHKGTRQAQLVFCDFSTPKADGSFNVYDDIKKKLVARGVPEAEVAFIHDANTEARKAELFAKVRSGAVRVLIGSTAKMGAGTNVQERLIAIHDLDCPWRPSDLEQRRGRIVRQGNTNGRVEVYRYVTENTFDAYLFQLVENKQRFIGQIMTSKSPVRSAEDVDETALSYAEIKALATGNPMIKERMDLDVEVARLKMLKADFLSQKYSLEDDVIKRYPERIKALEERIAGYVADIATAAVGAPVEEGAFSMRVGDRDYSERKAAGEAIAKAAQKMSSPAPVPLGQFAGFQLKLAFDKVSRAFECIVVGRLRHTLTLGDDAVGNIARIDNAIEAMPQRLASCKEQLENTKIQMANATEQAARPFDKEAELSEKSARLAELDALLDMDEKGGEVLDTPHSGDDPDMEPEREKNGIER